MSSSTPEELPLPILEIWRAWDRVYPGTSERVLPLIAKYIGVVAPLRPRPAPADLILRVRTAVSWVPGVNAKVFTDRIPQPHRELTHAIIDHLQAAGLTITSVQEDTLDEIYSWINSDVDESAGIVDEARFDATLDEGIPLGYLGSLLLSLAITQEMFGARVIEFAPLLDLWLAGVYVVGFIDDNTVAVYCAP
jgi:hypothetical protein